MPSAFNKFRETQVCEHSLLRDGAMRTLQVLINSDYDTATAR